MGHLPGVPEGIAGAANQCGKTPTRYECTEDHHERDPDGRTLDGDELRRGFGSRQPERRRKPTKYPKPVQHLLAREIQRSIADIRGQSMSFCTHWTIRSSNNPISRTMSGTQN